MLVHPNPMERIKPDYGIDTRLSRVEVLPFWVNGGKQHKRWSVYTGRRAGRLNMFVSRHITEEQAVVSAQTLANRIYLQLMNKTTKIARPPVHVTRDEGERLTTMLNKALVEAYKETRGQDGNARELAQQTVRLLRETFQLRGR